MPSPNDRGGNQRGSLSRDEIQAIRARYPIEQVIAAYADLRPAGRRLAARCPLPGHDDQNPSFVVYPDEGRFWCYGCQRGGDVFTFLQLVEGVTFREAMARLDPNGGSVPPLRMAPSPVPPRRPEVHSLGEEASKLLTAAVEVYHTSLLLNEAMLQYVTGRGIALESIRRFRLGYAAGDNLAKYLRFRGWDLRLAQELGLITDHGEFFRQRIIIPEWRQGRVVYLTGRKTQVYQRTKYLGLPGAPKPLYGLELSQGARKVLICEGAFDLVTLVQWGYPAVALLGAYLKPEWTDELAFAKHLFIVTDSDEAGRAAAQKLAEIFRERSIIVPPLPNAKDVNELAMRPDGQVIFARLLTLTQSEIVHSGG
jgi:DNA primase